jgi:hypothetical protein
MGMAGIVDDLIFQPFLHMGPWDPKSGNTVYHVDGQVEAVDLIFYGEPQGCVDVPLFFISAHMKVLVIGATVCEFVNQPGIAVEVENNRLVHGKEAVEVPIRKAVEMLGMGLQLEEIHDIYETDFQAREVLPEQSGRRQGFHGRHVACARDHHVGFTSLVAAGPGPDADALGAVPNRLIDGQVLEMRLLVRNNDVDIVDTTKTVVRHRKDTIGVGGQIDAGYAGALVCDQIQKARILVAETVMVLAPYGGGDQ